MYKNFAYIYDDFMESVDYEMWTDYLISIFEKFNIKTDLMCELGCGTGNITSKLVAKSYDVIGLDNSLDMLSVAREKNDNIMYLHQDMRELELFGSVDVFISICDSLNYITDIEDLDLVFSKINYYLNPGGYFIFDLNTEYKFKNILGNNTYTDTNDKGMYIWENYYDKKAKINEYDLTLFMKTSDDLFEKHVETHLEKAYFKKDIKSILKRYNLKLVNSFDAFTFNKPNKKSERIYYVVRKEK